MCLPGVRPAARRSAARCDRFGSFATPVAPVIPLRCPGKGGLLAAAGMALTLRSVLLIVTWMRDRETVRPEPDASAKARFPTPLRQDVGRAEAA